MQEAALCPIRIQDLTTTIQDTITHIRDIDIFIVSIDTGAINFTAMLTIGIGGFPIMNAGTFTKGLKICTGRDIEGQGIRTAVVMVGEVTEDKQCVGF